MHDQTGDPRGYRHPTAPDLPVADLGLLPGNEYIITSGGLKGQRGFFTHDPAGQVIGADLAGRRFTRVPAAQ